ncbi:hypothetical protein [Microbacterium sp. 77mftsu3.1]|uniref:hypothetical protein n=1 Tax=Microbacterium sp. 77mftsu3.1 TaxID=1761802 RepID=UPI0003663F0B|nr:hypothetical protein [Microbacterium sp. 77mftsu3.1]SDH53276.1 hypothetical protein SAMN04488590_3497 [Microbacterium sp. 77mftsu3.1]
MSVIFVSVNDTYRPGMSYDEAAKVAHAAWPITLATGRKVDNLVAVYKGVPIMAWPILGAYKSEETYETNGGPRPRIAFSLGGTIPLRPEWLSVPLNLRRGVMYALDI